MWRPDVTRLKIRTSGLSVVCWMFSDVSGNIKKADLNLVNFLIHVVQTDSTKPGRWRNCSASSECLFQTCSFVLLWDELLIWPDLTKKTNTLLELPLLCFLHTGSVQSVDLPLKSRRRFPLKKIKHTQLLSCLSVSCWRFIFVPPPRRRGDQKKTTDKEFIGYIF